MLHILNEVRPSGAETMLRAASGFWREHGIEGEILITGDRRGEFAPSLADAGYRLHHLPFRRSAGFLCDVRRFFGSHRYDSVHIHCERANFWYALLAFASGRPRIVRSVHALFPFRGLLWMRRWLQRFVMRRAFGVTTVAVGAAVQRVESTVYRNPALHIPNWFDSARYRPGPPERRGAARRALGIDGDEYAVATVGNCSPEKNHSALIAAIAGLGTRDRIVYLHAGCEDASRTEAELAGRLGVDARFLGPLADVAGVFAAADLFVMPSLHEGAGIAAMEALGTGVPSLLADVDGLRELREVADCEWTSPGAEEIAAALKRCMAQDRAALRERALLTSERIHSRFAIAHGAARYAELYLAGRGGQPC